jgi:hypothetical protein
MRWKPHVRFGGRAGETHPVKAGQGAPARPLHVKTHACWVPTPRDVDALDNRAFLRGEWAIERWPKSHSPVEICGGLVTEGVVL